MIVFAYCPSFDKNSLLFEPLDADTSDDGILVAEIRESYLTMIFCTRLPASPSVFKD